MATMTPRFTLTDIEVNQSQKEVTHNESLQIIDGVLHGVFLDRGLSAPPVLISPGDDGKTYLVLATGTGAWAGRDGNIAYFRSSGWTFIVPEKGMRFWIEDEDIFVLYNGTEWIPEGQTNLSRLSIESQGLTAPPGGETDGQAWIVDSVATGAWAGQEDDIAIFRDTAWTFLTPIEGETFWIKDRDIFSKWSGTAWQAIRSDELFKKGLTSRTLSAPPALTSPGDDGKTYIVGPTATGAWTGREDDIAVFRLDTWEFYTPLEGWTFFANVENKKIIFDGTAWGFPPYEILLRAGLIDKDISATPGSPTLGDLYIVGSAPTGIWATHADDIAYWNGVIWQFFTPVEGWTFWLNDENRFYTFTGAAWLPEAGRRSQNIMFNFNGDPLPAGTYYTGGYYDAPAADANLSQSGTTQVHGTANISYAAHALLVAAGAGTATGGAGAVTIVVTGTSIADEGTRTATDSETIVADITTMATNQYFETAKKWIGQITYTLTVGGAGHTAYAADFNFGFAKYTDFKNTDFTLRDFDLNGFANAADSSFELELLAHNSIGWTYSTAAFTPGNIPVASLVGDHSAEDEIGLDLPFAWKRDNLTSAIAGSGAEGVLLRVVTSVADAVNHINMNLGITTP